MHMFVDGHPWNERFRYIVWCSVGKSWQVTSWQLKHWIVCLKGGVDRHIGWVSVDTSVDISAECQFTVVRGSVEYRSSIGQRADWASVDMWLILSPYNLSVDRLSIVGHYFVDGSPTYHQHWVDTSIDCWFRCEIFHFQFRSYHSFVPLTSLVFLGTKKQLFSQKTMAFCCGQRM